jgi:integrase
MTRFNFTKASISKLNPDASGIVTYHDTKEKGLSLYVTKGGAKTYFIRKRVNGKDERIILGSFPVMTCEQARRKALIIKGVVADGKDPNEERHRLNQEITFGELFDEYMIRYSKKHKKSWKYDEREINKFLPHWFGRKISTINQQEIRLLHEQVREDNGLYQANRLLERIKAIYNKAIEWGWQGSNPAHYIKKYREQSRDRFIQPVELPCLFKALDAETNETARDYIWLSLLSGARKANVLAMRWDEINWSRQEWRIPDTKNNEPVTIPISQRANEILIARHENKSSQWVFPSPRNSNKHLADPKKTWERVRKQATIFYWQKHPEYNDVIKQALASLDESLSIHRQYLAIVTYAEKKGIELPSGLMDLRLHDIRRTMGSYQAINGASLAIIGKSLGHKSQQATQVYSRLNLDPVRASMEQAFDSMFALQNDEKEKHS